MVAKKIPIINEQLDLQVLILIVRKTFIWGVLIGIFSLAIAFLFIRYTQPVFESSSVIQINSKDNADRFLKIESIWEPSDGPNLASIIELMRSSEFLRRTFDKLPLKTAYFWEGTFLSEELYRSSPYTIETKINNSSVYGVPLYVNFKKDFSYSIVENGVEIISNQEPDTWCDIGKAKINLSITNYHQIKASFGDLKRNQYYFMIKNPNTLIAENANRLAVSVLNPSAQTVIITFQDNNAEKTTEIVNALAAEFIDYDVEKKSQSAQNILTFIDQQTKIVLNELSATESQLHEFKKNYGINTESEKELAPNRLFSAKVNEFGDEILKLDFELITLQNIQKQIKASESLNIYSLIALLSGTKSEGIIVSVLNTINQLINSRDQLLNNVTDKNFQIKMIDKQIESQKLLLGEFISSSVARLEEKKEEYEKKLKEFENRSFDGAQYSELELAKLNRIYSIHESYYDQLISKQAEYLISQASYVSNNVILETATIPTFSVYPEKRKIVAMAVAIALLVFLGIIVTRYLLYNKVSTERDITNYTHAPMIGLVPKVNLSELDEQLIVDLRPNSLFSESFRNIRSNLQFIEPGDDTKVITVSSTISGEGKTLIAINLAGILSLTGKKVVLLDMDLRKPRIHLALNTPNKCGLSTLLINKHTLDECLNNTRIECLKFISAGPMPPNPSELANGNALKELILSLKERFDFIVIDTSPIGLVSDAMMVLTMASYPIYLSKSEYSRKNYANNINYLIEDRNLTRLSIILNNFDTKGGKYGYGGSNGYGYGYGVENPYLESDLIDKKPTLLFRIFKWGKNKKA